MGLISDFHSIFTKQLVTDISDLFHEDNTILSVPTKILAFDFGFGGWFSHKLLDLPRYITSSGKLMIHEFLHELATIHTNNYSDGIIEIDSKEMGLIGRLLNGVSLDVKFRESVYQIKIVATDLMERIGFLGYAHFEEGTAYQNFVNYLTPLITLAAIGPLMATYAKTCKNYMGKAFWTGLGLYFSFEPTFSYFTNKDIEKTDSYKVTANALSMMGININDEYSAIYGTAMFITTLMTNLLFYSVIRKTGDYITGKIKEII